MKRLIVLFIACLLGAVGVNQTVIRNNALADKAYALDTARYTAPSDDSEAWVLDIYNEPEEPAKHYNIPLSPELQQFVVDNCRDVDIRIIFAVMFCESEYDQGKVNGGCVGIMQIKKSAHADRIARLGADINNVNDNILVGVDILSEHINKYGLHRGLIAYSCGEYSDDMKYTSIPYSRDVVAYAEGLK